MRKMVVGVHGVGKSTYLKNNNNEGFIIVSCSFLLKHEKDKRIGNISDNQKLLVKAVSRLENNNYIFDGHTVLANSSGFEMLSEDIFDKMGINELELLIDTSEGIYSRLLKRDNKSEFTIEKIRLMQEKEVLNCHQISAKLNIPLKIVDYWKNKNVKIHNLKIDKNYFNEIKKGNKNFEIRFNDRDYQKDDLVILNEVVNGEITDNKVIKRISYLLDDFQPIKEINYVVFELENL